MERRIIEFMSKLLENVKKISNLINDADYILIGAGSGLSTSAGLEYTGERFTKNFSDFIKKYHFTDMYTSSFYDFNTEEEKWAYWAKHIYLNDTGVIATDLYKNILELVKDKEYFVITTNVDDQFLKQDLTKTGYLLHREAIDTFSVVKHAIMIYMMTQKW